MAEKVEQRSVSVRIDGKEVENSIKSISAEIRALRLDTQKLSEGTADYTQKALSLAQANEVFKRNQEATKAIADAWKLMPDTVRQSVTTMQTSLSSLQAQFKEMGSLKTPEMSGIETDIAAITAQVKETRAQFKETELSIKDNISGLSSSLKDLKTNYQELSDAGKDVKSPEMKALRAEIKAVNDELKDSKTQYATLKTEQQTTLKAMQDNLASLKKRYEELQKAQKEATTPEMKALEKEIQKVQDEIVQTTKEFVKLGEVAPNSLQGLETAYSELYSEIKKTDKAAADYAHKVEKLKDLEGQINDHKQGLKGIEEGWLKNIPSIGAFAAAAVAAFAVDKIREFGAALMHNAVEMDTNLRKAASVLANDLGKINNEAEKHAHSFGIARSQYVGATADMSAFFQSQFATREEGAKLGNEAVKLAGILAGFKGGGAEQFAEALEAMKGGFSDNVEELAKFNIALSDDIIKAALAEKGIDKLNAKQQEHAKGLVLLELIQKKATAQIQAFGDTSGSVARNSAELQAMLKEISDTLSKILIPILGTALAFVKPLVDGLGKMADTFETLANPISAASDAFELQKAKVKDLEKNINPLLARYDELISRYSDLEGQSKLSSKEQVELKDVIKRIGEAVPTATNEVDNYGKALSINAGKAREFVSEQIRLMNYLNKDAIDKEQANLDILTYQHKNALEAANRAHNGEMKEKVNKLLPAESFFNEMRDLNEKELAAFDKQVAAFAEKIDGARLNLKRLRGEPLAALPEAPKPDLTGKSEKEMQDAENRAKQIQNDLKKLREAVKAHNSDLLAQNMRDDERDAERIHEKYRRDIELAQELEKEKGKVGIEAHKLKLELEAERDAEIVAKKKENAEKIIDDLKQLSSKYGVDQGDLLLDELGKKLADIKAKFAAEFAKVAKAEESSADPSVKAQAKQTRLDLERAENAALQEERTKHVMEIAKKQEELWQKTQLANADGMDKEILQVIFSHQNLIDQNIKNHDEVAALIESQQKQIADIKKKYRDADTHKAENANKHQMELMKKLNEAETAKQKSSFQTLQSFTGLIGAVLGDAAKHSVGYFALTKGLAIAEILMNANRESSAIKLAYAAQAAWASTTPKGLLLAPGLIATGNTLAAQAMLRGALSAATVAVSAAAEWKANQKAEGGFVDVIGAQDGKQYHARNGGRATTGPVLDPTVFLAGEQPEYVIAYPETKNPIVANLIGVAESIRQRRVRGYESGGYVESSNVPAKSQTTTVNTTNNTTTSDNSALLGVMNRFLDVIQAGIYAKFTTEDAFELRKMQNKAVSLAGYEPK